MVSQFVSSHAVNLLGNIAFDFPEGTHAIGRLDNNSEGLLILTTNKKVTRLLFQGAVPHKRTYLVLVNDAVTEEQVTQLQNGVQFKITGGELYTTKPSEVLITHALPSLYLAPSTLNPTPSLLYPLPYTPNERVSHTWLSITLTEGKFHQVRKMLAAVRLKCKRLVRTSIEDLALGNLQPGEVREMEEGEFFQLLNF